jgi:hypothetical protein
MNPKLLHNLTWVPLSVIAVSAVALGLSWVVVVEPWLLDRAANEALLQVSFRELLAAGVNAHLPDYFRLSYRFFGWWLLSVGLLLGAYVRVTRMGTRLARNTLHLVLAIVLVGIYVIEYTFIPRSPFVWLTHGLTLLFLISFLASWKLKAFD